MRIINLSYNTNNNYSRPLDWLNRVAFFSGVLKALALSHEVIDIHFINNTGILTIDNVSNHFLHYRRYQLLVPTGFHAYLKRLYPDVVIVHGLIFSWQIILLRLQLGSGVKIIVQHHAERPGRWPRTLFQRISDRYVHRYLFSSKELARAWLEMGLIRAPSKICEVLGASSPFTPVDRKEARAFTGISGKVVFLWVGRLDRNKDPLTVVRAFLRFREVYGEAVLYMIFQSDLLLGELQTFIRDNGGSNAIKMVGRVRYSDLSYWYSSADYFLSGSHYESAGIAVCEAMSCGCIPIVTDIPSFRLMTKNGEVGALYSPGNSDELLNVMISVSLADQVAMRERVLARFREQFSFEANARKYYEAFSG